MKTHGKIEKTEHPLTPNCVPGTVHCWHEPDDVCCHCGKSKSDVEKIEEDERWDYVHLECPFCDAELHIVALHRQEHTAKCPYCGSTYLKVKNEKRKISHNAARGSLIF